MPATKGASYRYGNTHGSGNNCVTTHIKYAWARDFNNKTLKQHFERHGKQMGCETIESYRAKAIRFANTVDRKNCVSFVDKKDTTYKYNKKTNTLALIDNKGYVITYYKPTDGYKYYKSEKKKRGKHEKGR